MRRTRFLLSTWIGLAALCGAPDLRAAIVDVTIAGFAFSPRNLTIRQGDTVRWTNQDPIGHNAVSGTNCTPDGRFDTPLLSQGQSASVEFTNAGFYAYYCRPHCVGMTATLTVEPASNAAPVVSITSPANASAFAPATSVTIEANASDPDGTVAKVEFFDGGTSLGVDATSPYSISATLPPGAHTLTAVATDAAGAATTSAAVTVNVGNIVDVTIAGFAFSPRNLTVREGDVVRWTNQDTARHNAVSGTNCAPDGRFATALLAQGQSASVLQTTAGFYPYYCQPHCAGMTATLTVESAANSAPVVSITSPTNNAVLPGTTNLTIEATATDPNGTVAKVEFFDGLISLGTDTSSPYSVTISLAPGAHTLSAVATDDGGASTSSAVVTITVSGIPIPDPIPAFITKGDLAIDLETLVDGLASPLGMGAPDDGSGRMFVYDQSGLVWVVTPAGKLPTPLLDVRSRLVTLGAYDERGLLGLAVHPNFAQNPLIYTYTSEPNGPEAEFPSMMPAGKTNNHQSVIAEWRIDPANTNQVDLASRREILRIDQPQSNHNGGTIHFGPDGFLYIASGDGGNANDVGDGHMPGGNAQDTMMALGKMLRIDVHGTNSVNGRYGVPSDNPFVSGSGLPEIYAYGFRNPFQWSFDRSTGQGYVADVGQNRVEEIDLLTKGGNYGWNIKEGTFWFDPSTGEVVTAPMRPAPPNLIDPIAQYGHGEGLAVIGGFVYRGNAIPALQGRYVFGDWGSFAQPSARLFYLDATNTIREFKLGLNDRPLNLWVKGFGEGADGELYVFASRILGPAGNTGKMMKVVPVPNPVTLAAASSDRTNLTMNWTGGGGPYALQEKSSVADPLWRNAAFTALPAATTSLGAGSGIFRVFDTAGQSGIPFTAYISGAMERPNPVTTEALGSGTFSLEGNTLAFNITYRGLSGPATAAHIHGPATAAATGGVLINLAPYTVGTLDTQGVFSGVVVLTDEQKAVILAGQTYVNVHSAGHPAGEIRGQIAPVLMQAALSGANERPAPVTTPGNGLGMLALVGNELSLNVTYQGLTAAASAAHIHGPATAENGAGVLVNLAPLNGGAFGAGGSLAGKVTLTPEQLAYVIDGLTYINFHTPNNPPGEIRGQIVPQSAGVPFTAFLTGEAERPNPVATTGNAAGIFSLEGDALRFSLTYSNLSGAATGAHIHGPAQPSQNAGVLVDLAPFSVGPLAAAGALSGSVALTPAQRNALLKGQTYVNFHTAANPPGEIRGQIVPVLMTASMSGSQERPAVVTDGSGSGTFTLVGNQLGFNVSYGGLTGTATASHIHGPAGAFANAGVLVDFSPFNGGSWGKSGSLAGSVTLNATNLVHVLSGQTYINVHSTAFGPGEIRGQITR
jgi:plastocyanin/glucose/arabinose dehydrogenase